MRLTLVDGVILLLLLDCRQTLPSVPDDEFNEYQQHKNEKEHLKASIHDVLPFLPRSRVLS
jgi:hypothetical protein